MKICIDPGHGGYDPGAVNHNVGVTEKALALKIAALVGGELASRGYDVFFTRELDTFIPLGFRTKIANNEKADLFISIHLNAAADPAAQGIETWYYEGSSKMLFDVLLTPVRLTMVENFWNLFLLGKFEYPCL